MSEPLFSEPIDSLAAGYVLGDLDREQTERFEQRLATDPELAQEVSRLQNVLAEVLCGLNEVAPPPQLRSSILRSIRPAQRRTQLPWNKVMGSVAAVILLALGVNNYQLRQELNAYQETSTLLQQSKTRLFSLQGQQIAKQAQGSFVLNLEQQKGILAVQNLPAPPAGKVYRLWAVVDGEKLPCGQLRLNPQGAVLAKFSMPADFYESGISALLVTLEPSESARQPVGPTVMATRV